MIKVCPSSNPCPEKDLIKYIHKLEDLGVEYLHCDVMDGKFVPNTCLDLEALREARNNTNILLDIHLMVENVYENVEKFASLKPNIITIHYEALKDCKEFERVRKFLKKEQILMGLAIKPNTPVEIVSRLLKVVDLILIMTVEPGKSGQKLIEECIQKIQVARDLIADSNVIIEVDGGINEDNYNKIIKAGGRFLVMGSAFYNSKEPRELLHKVDKHYK